MSSGLTTALEQATEEGLTLSLAQVGPVQTKAYTGM